MAADTCDPRKTGCTAYHFPHRRNSNPHQPCVWQIAGYQPKLTDAEFRELYMGSFVASYWTSSEDETCPDCERIKRRT